MATEAQDDELIREAWRLLREALETGEPTLASGIALKLAPQDILAVARWVASLKPPKRRHVPRPEDFILPAEKKEPGDGKE